MKMKDVILKTGLPEKTIRYYELRGLVRPATERRNGRTYHEYSPADVEALCAVISLRKAQFSIEEILLMQSDPEKIPEVSAGLRSRIQQETDILTKLLEDDSLFQAGDYLTLSKRLEAAMTAQETVIPPFRFGAEDRETPEEKAAAVAAYRKRHSRRWWIPTIVILSLLCVVLGVGLGCKVYQDVTAIPQPEGSTQGWIYYTYGMHQILYRCREDGSDRQRLYASSLGGPIASVTVAEEKVYFMDGQQMYSINADGSGVYRFKPRFYSSYAITDWGPVLAGEHLYALEFSSGQLGGSNSCVVRISTRDGSAARISLPEEIFVSTLTGTDGIVYVVGYTVTEYGEEEYEAQTLYELLACDPETGSILNRKTLENGDTISAMAAEDDRIYIAQQESPHKSVIYTLNTQTLEQEYCAEVLGSVEDFSGIYCRYQSDYEGSDLGGIYYGWYIMNLETGATTGFSYQEADFGGYAETGILIVDKDGAVSTVPYP